MMKQMSTQILAQRSVNEINKISAKSAPKRQNSIRLFQNAQSTVLFDYFSLEAKIASICLDRSVNCSIVKTALLKCVIN